MSTATLQRRPLVKQILAGADDNLLVIAGLGSSNWDITAAGAWLGGQRSVLLMQSSGVGNTINMLGLTRTLRFPFLTLITMRGDWGEFNSWQYPMGQATPKVLAAMGLQVYPVEQADDVATTVDAAARAAFNGGQAVAVLLRQKLIGIKTFGKK